MPCVRVVRKAPWKRLTGNGLQVRILCTAPNRIVVYMEAQRPRWRFKSFYAHLYALVAQWEEAIGLSPIKCEFESHRGYIIWSHRINGQFTGLSIRKCWVRVPLGSLWLSYNGQYLRLWIWRYGFDSHRSHLINAVCPGSEGAVLKTVGQKWLAGANPVCGAYRWMSRIEINKRCFDI